MNSTSAETRAAAPTRRRVNSREFFPQLMWSTSIFACTVGLALFLERIESGLWGYPLYLGGAFSLFFFWRSLKYPDVVSKYASFASVFLIAGVLNRFLYLADFWQSGDRFHLAPIYSHDPLQSLIIGEILTVGGTLLTCATWVRMGGLRYSPGIIFGSQKKRAGNILLLTYLASLVGLLLSVASAGLVSALGQLLPVMTGLGIAASLVLPSLWTTNARRRLSIAAVMSIPMVGYALGSGRKEFIILALLPSGVFLWRAVTALWGRIFILSTGLALLALITSYVGYYRTEVWGSKDTEARTGDVIESFEEEIGQDVTGTLAKGIEGFLNRANASLHRGWAVDFTDQHGHQPELVFEPMTYVFVPRMIWPDKPAIRQGQIYNVMLHGGNGESQSSMAAGFYTSLNMGGGWSAAAIGALAMGLVMAGLGHLSFRLGGSVLAGLFAFAIVPFALRLDDSWSVGALSGPVVQFAYIAALYFLNRGVLALAPSTQSRAI